MMPFTAGFENLIDLVYGFRLFDLGYQSAGWRFPIRSRSARTSAARRTKESATEIDTSGHAGHEITRCLWASSKAR